MDKVERRAREHLAANVRRHRLAARLTQAGLGERVGVEPWFIRAIEAAREAPSFKTLVMLARVLGVEVRDLFEPVARAIRNPGRPRKLQSDLDVRSDQTRCEPPESVARGPNPKGRPRAKTRPR